MAAADHAQPADRSVARRPLTVVNLYRIGLAVALAAMGLSGLGAELFVSFDEALFTWLSIGYLGLGAVWAAVINRRLMGGETLVAAQAFTDLALLTLLMHAAGGVASGLGVLLVAAIAMASALTAGRLALLFAAMATLFVLAHQFYMYAQDLAPVGGYTQAGFLGAGFFATAALAHVLARRLQESERLAAQRGVDLANMAQLNDYIIQRMDVGVVVVGPERRVRLVNAFARHLLGIPGSAGGRDSPLEDVAPALARQLEAWLADPNVEPEPFTADATDAELQPRFARTGDDPAAGVLIFLEDTSGVAERARQMKLASLGRLTASIAHEIRNPLGAISHAGQLLGESDHLPREDRRLTGVIQEQSRRVNGIVENILQLSRRDTPQPANLALKPWLEAFAGEFTQSHDLDPRALAVVVEPPDLEVRVDPGQLHQVLWNLGENALIHGTPDGARPHVALRAAGAGEGHGATLEVADRGAGIPPERAHEVFEPFFTTRRDGTGLGLYIARELCESNHARLTYHPRPDGGCFQIRFNEAYADRGAA